MDMREITTAIEALEKGETNYTTCGRLATLYAVRNGLNSNNGQVMASVKEAPVASFSRSEFTQKAARLPAAVLADILDEHIESIKELYPREYRKIMNKIEAAEV